MRFGGRVFRPSLVPALATAVLLPLLATLGFWQLDRAEQKRQLELLFDQGSIDPVDLGAIIDEHELRRYQSATANGRYDSEHQFLLDNIVHQGRVGFYVLTPLKLDRVAAGVLVNRGWIPALERRENLPEIGAHERPRSVHGRLDRLPRPGIELDAPDETRWPRVVQFPKMADLENSLDYSLLGYQLLLDPDLPDGYQREWAPTEFGPARHLGYAVQWFGLALALLTIFVVVNLEKIEPSDG